MRPIRKESPPLTLSRLAVCVCMCVGTLLLRSCLYVDHFNDFRAGWSELKGGAIFSGQITREICLRRSHDAVYMNICAIVVFLGVQF